MLYATGSASVGHPTVDIIQHDRSLRVNFYDSFTYSGPTQVTVLRQSIHSHRRGKRIPDICTRKSIDHGYSHIHLPTRLAVYFFKTPYLALCQQSKLEILTDRPV